MLKALTYAFRGTVALLFAVLALAAIANPAALLPLIVGAGGIGLAVTSADLTTLDELLKQAYDSVIAEQQNLAAMTYKEFAEGDDGVTMPGGKGLYFETKMGGNQEGIGARAERGTLPAAGRQRYKQGVIRWGYIYGTFEITGPAIEAAKSNLASFANARMEEIKGLTADLLKDHNRITFGDGSATVARVTADGPLANTFYINQFDAQYVRLNMMIDVWRVNTNVIDSRQVTGLTKDGTGWYVTYDGADVAAASGDLMMREDAATLVGGVRTSLEPDGLKKIADDGTVAATYLGITRASFPLWAGHLLSNSGTARNISADLLFEAEDRIQRATGEAWDWCRINQGQRRKYFELVSGDRRYVTSTFDAGYERLDFQGKKITVDIDCCMGEWFFAQKAKIKKYTLRGLGIMDQDGRSIRQVQGQDLYRGHLAHYYQLATKQPNACARITDLVEPAFSLQAS